VISCARFIAAICLLVAACENVVGFDYRVASKDPKVTSAQMLKVVTEARVDVFCNGEPLR